MSEELAPMTDDEKGIMHKRWHLINSHSCTGEWESAEKLLESFLDLRRGKFSRQITIAERYGEITIK